MVLCSDVLYPAISITSSFAFSPVHDILILTLMYDILLLQVFFLGRL